MRGGDSELGGGQTEGQCGWRGVRERSSCKVGGVG